MNLDRILCFIDGKLSLLERQVAELATRKVTREQGHVKEAECACAEPGAEPSDESCNCSDSECACRDELAGVWALEALVAAADGAARGNGARNRAAALDGCSE